ncbi:unnamed protein product [Albugo candida]|uniref:Thioredoxin domain-containing protein n=1 Tax=Albugo candida TaxID=65357 RepID=A0A024GKW3_9STRA|nr:unnamed protein product [Albugo candida]|eukprot:CCI46961.1 unnamed protein product [Albugo candida]
MKSSGTKTQSALTNMRLMQVAFAFLTLISMMCVYRFVSVTTNPFADMPPTSTQLIKRKLTIDGFPDAHKFVSEYDVQKSGHLYLLFVSSLDEDGNYWCSDCRRAKAPIERAFTRAPMDSTLLEIYVGDRAKWKDMQNEFRQNQLFYIDNIPTVMRYDGNGNSSNMLTENFCLDKELLDYVFRVPTLITYRKNHVFMFYNAKDVIDYLDKYDNTYPLFINFISGRHKFNGRLWCPFCDRAEVATMYYFNTTAPDSAVMLKVIVSNSYEEWDSTDNSFRNKEFGEKVLQLTGIPYLGRVSKNIETGKLHLEEFKTEFDQRTRLIRFYSGNTTI